MAYLWQREAAGWAARALSRDSLQYAPGIVLVREAASGAWVLCCAPGLGVRVNGHPVRIGLRVLADRDEIRVPGEASTYFAAETLPRVEQYTSADAVRCARCREPLARGEPAVRCPGCGTWHHETGDLPCWTYAETCAACPGPTAFQRVLRWAPE